MRDDCVPPVGARSQPPTGGRIKATSFGRGCLLFSGKVLGISQDPYAKPPDVLHAFNVVSFHAYHVWKGEISDPIIIVTPNQGGACGYKFSLGEDYLVYAKSSPFGFRTTICFRTQPFSEAKLDLAILPVPEQVDPECTLGIDSPDEFVKGLITALKCGERGQTYSQLVDSCPLHSKLVPHLITVVLDSEKMEEWARITAIKTLGSYGYKARSAVPALIEILKDPNPSIRMEAATSLRNIFPESEFKEPDFFDLASQVPYEEYLRVSTEFSKMEVLPNPPEHLRDNGGIEGRAYKARR